ncbi:MAG TPA: hypothetical protein VGK02_12280 [Candidatus Aquicultor sp.]
MLCFVSRTCLGAKSLIYSLLILCAAIPLGCAGAENQVIKQKPYETKVMHTEWSGSERGIISTVRTVGLETGAKTIALRQSGKIDGLKVSPNSKKLAFIMDRSSLYVCDIDGKNRRLIDRSVLGWAAWSSQNNRIAYVKWDSNTSKSTVMVCNVRNRAKAALNLSVYANMPCAVLDWYPHDAAIAVYVRGGSETENTLVKFDMSTGKVSKVADNALLRGFTKQGNLIVTRPIAVEDSSTANRVPNQPKIRWYIYLGKDNGSFKKIIKDGSRSAIIAASSDGGAIAFSKVDGSRGDQLFMANSDGTGERRLTDLSSYTGLIPAWSPDKRYIVFAATRRRGQDSGTYLYRYDMKNRTVKSVFNQGEKPSQVGSVFAVFK